MKFEIIVITENDEREPQMKRYYPGVRLFLKIIDLLEEMK